ncbi:alpha/beta hydrolase [Cryobacterium lactosi]|nr:alpha/beta hydrolase [Cryobacterium lactosi]
MTTGHTARSRTRARIQFAGWTALTALALGVVAFLIWTQLVMPADRAAAQAVFDNPAVTVTDTAASVVIAPAENPSDAGLVFIPGAKVDPYAYLATLSGTVEETGMTVVITKPVLNLAFFDQRPLDAFTAAAPDVSTWFVGGHSLGGVRACMYTQDTEVAGLVVFGSYCAAAVDDDLPVLSISGSEDGLSTPAKIEDTADLLPAGTTFVQIDGANHASFGAYGDQPGDGVATITPAESQQAITDALSTFIAPLAVQSE